MSHFKNAAFAVFQAIYSYESFNSTMSSSKEFRARNQTSDVRVIIEFDDDNLPIQVRCAEGRRNYEIKSIVERHGLLTIRDLRSYDLLSIFYNP